MGHDQVDRGVCGWCDEPVLPDDHAVAINAGTEWMHRECITRSVGGGLNHLRKECHCFRGDAGLDPDPPGMTKREAARAARDWWLNAWE